MREGRFQASSGATVEWGEALRPYPGAAISGDSGLVRPLAGGALVAAIDGLGHGEDAAEASRAAVEVLSEAREADLDALFHRCHEALRGTRGAAMSLAFVDLDRAILVSAGVGNVSGFFIPRAGIGRTHRWLHPQAGIVGFNLPTIHPQREHLASGDMLVWATDGIRSGFLQDAPFHQPPRLLAEHVLSHHARETDDALVLVLRYDGGGRDGGGLDRRSLSTCL